MAEVQEHSVQEWRRRAEQHRLWQQWRRRRQQAEQRLQDEASRKADHCHPRTQQAEQRWQEHSTLVDQEEVALPVAA